jgi:hypothetical protein
MRPVRVSLQDNTRNAVVRSTPLAAVEHLQMRNPPDTYAGYWGPKIERLARLDSFRTDQLKQEEGETKGGWQCRACNDKSACGRWHPSLAHDICHLLTRRLMKASIGESVDENVI